MSQVDILNILKQNKEKEYSTNDLGRILKINTKTVAGNCRRLRHSGFVSYWRRVNLGGTGGHEFVYKHKEGKL